MIAQKVLAALTLTLLLSGCFETKEQIAARQAQFNGKTVAQVAGVIGKPIARDRTKAIWQYHGTYTRSEPTYIYVNGQRILSGYRTIVGNLDCTFTAALQAGRVKNATYVGNSCARYAPKLKKK